MIFERSSAWRIKCCAVLPAMLLAGCAALQIDVDVYKGSLVATQDVQQRQYAYMAIAAKPVIKRMRDAATSQLEICGRGASDKTKCDLIEQGQDFLDDIVLMYGPDAPSEERVQARQPSRSAQAGLDQLTEDLRQRLAEPPSAARKAQLDQALLALNERLVEFAVRILFVVNNESLFSEFSGGGSGVLAVQRPVLQSLANTILVHANDLERQIRRDHQQKQHLDRERAAAAYAFRVPPAVAFDLIARGLRYGTVLAPTALAAPVPQTETHQRLRDALAKTARDDEALADFRKRVQPLLAAYRTLVREPTPLLHSLPSSATDRKAADLDRRSIVPLFPAQALEADRRETASAWTPLRQWLERERGAAQTEERKARLAQALAHLESDQARMLPNPQLLVQQADVLDAITLRLDQDIGLAGSQATELANAAKLQHQEAERLTQKVKDIDRRALDRERKATEQKQKRSDRDKVAAVLNAVRSTVLDQADKAKTQDVASVKSLLLLQLEARQSVATPAGGPKADDFALARLLVQGYEPVSLAMAPCAALSDGDDLNTAERCSGKTQIEVVDGLIADLRAQRVQALAAGNPVLADQLLEAINVAYEQRAAMIYLRPASDYLRSVHAATDLQDGVESQYRNMLTQWSEYMRPGSSNDDKPRRHQLEQLDKLNWQNINRVSLGGGGFTNFVLAKDDVGNWYVKAYSSDPQSILKSATSLALFNAGGRVNVNLLERHELRSRIEETSDRDEKDRLTNQLADLQSQDGRPLLAVKGRWSQRYDEDTRSQAIKTHAAIKNMPTAMSTSIESMEVSAVCKKDLLKKALVEVDRTGLETAFKNLEGVVGVPTAVEESRLTIEREKSVREGLTALHLYGARVHKALHAAVESGCDESARKAAAEKAQAVQRTALVTIATERRQAIDRYEEALLTITDVATQR
jgi:hypothetical protein